MCKFEVHILIIIIFDYFRAKIAATLLKKKLDSGLPKVVFLALVVTDQAMVKCGYPFHVQVGNKEYINSMIGVLHNQDFNQAIHKKVLSLIETWGKRFERDHDILPLFSDVYKALLRKGTDFGSGAVAPPSRPAAQPPSRPQPAPVLSKSESKNVKELPPKLQTIVEQMNLLKGNINFTNEIIDNCKTKQDMQRNETLIDLVKALKEMEPKLFELIQKASNEDIMKMCLLVNEDL